MELAQRQLNACSSNVRSAKGLLITLLCRRSAAVTQTIDGANSASRYICVRNPVIHQANLGNPLLCLEDVTALLRIAESEDVSFAELLELFFTTDELLSHALSHASFYLSIDGGSVQVDGQVVNLRTSTRLDAIDRDAVADLYNEGHMTQAELGRLFGVSRQAVHQICFGSDYESNLAPRNDSANGNKQ